MMVNRITIHFANNFLTYTWYFLFVITGIEYIYFKLFRVVDIIVLQSEFAVSFCLFVSLCIYIPTV